MKKFWLFIFSTFIALGIAYFSKKSPGSYADNKPNWKTFEKHSNNTIVTHPSTNKELLEARIPTPKRSIAEVKTKPEEKNELNNIPKDRNYQLREDRILFGDLEKRDYQDEQIDLEMVNKVNPNWKEILGNDLLRFQQEDTKVMIKEEFPMIKIQNGKGQYLEQVIITYAFKNGNFSSFHALVDSDSGFVTETWDKTVNEKIKPNRAELTLPEFNNSGIITR